MLCFHFLCDCNIIVIFVQNLELMKVFERVKSLRVSKKISQESIAFELSLNQSQYSRRECGEIPFTADEVEKLSSILDVKISELYGEETIIFNKHNQKGGTLGQYITVPDKLIEQYEERLKEKETIIQLLREQIAMLKNR